MTKISLIFIGLFFIFSCSNKPDVEVTLSDDSDIKNNEVFVVNHGWHTGFVVSSESAYKQIPGLQSRFGDTDYIEFGWGDKGFYKANKITADLVVRAIFWPTESVVHTVSVPVKPSEFFPNSEIIKLCLSENAYAGLVRFIKNSFKQNNDKTLVSLSKGIYGNSQFFKGEGDYYLFNTCNKWTAKGLASAGLDITTGFKLTASSIMDYLYDLPADTGKINYACKI